MHIALRDNETRVLIKGSTKPLLVTHCSTVWAGQSYVRQPTDRCTEDTPHIKQGSHVTSVGATGPYTSGSLSTDAPSSNQMIVISLTPQNDLITNSVHF